MDQKWFSFIEVFFTGAVVMGVLIWQLVSVNREIAKDKAKAAAKASEEAAGHPVGEHRLDEG